MGARTAGSEQLLEQYDVVVVGGGAAGLAGALTTARALRSTLVVDAGEPRNAPALGVHGYLGREGTAPGELVAVGRAEVEAYGGQVVEGAAEGVERIGSGGPADARFRVELTDGRSVLARELLLATGVEDVLPAVPGLRERWGLDVLHCPFCHGREVADQVVGVLSTSALGPDQALMWRGWSERVVLLEHTGPDPSPEQAEAMAARGVERVGGEVAGLDVEDDRLTGVRLVDGRLVALGALVTASRVVPARVLLDALGVPVVPLQMGPSGPVLGEHVPADPMGGTDVPGVSVAGNLAAPMATVLACAAAGATAGARVVRALVDADTAAAVARARASVAA
ncbi:NAD(P)/FAD-dependent oxidoreductase [Pseudokineococcus sp. 1T1Z-3]|uniref:NAD(P)/FAD-dependent oxidoreductase n=1 Tax=Pseudokineococcus sp. 1T1Z-3 TaxID=3132745 RepID=UPI0030AC0966